MASITKDIDLAVPLRTAYDQWTQFELFPRFMEGVKEVEQIDETHLRWRADISGREETWEAEITEQISDRRIAWRSMSGIPIAGAVAFTALDDGHCRIQLAMDYD